MPTSSPSSEMTREEKIAARSVTRATPQPATALCPGCGGPTNPQTHECRGCSD